MITDDIHDHLDDDKFNNINKNVSSRRYYVNPFRLHHNNNKQRIPIVSNFESIKNRLLTTSRLFSHRPQGLSSKISLSSSESSPLSSEVFLTATAVAAATAAAVRSGPRPLVGIARQA